MGIGDQEQALNPVQGTVGSNLGDLIMVTPVGSPATIHCEPRQARKGAAAAVDSGAGVWLARVASISP